MLWETAVKTWLLMSEVTQWDKRQITYVTRVVSSDSATRSCSAQKIAFWYSEYFTGSFSNTSYVCDSKLSINGWQFTVNNTTQVLQQQAYPAIQPLLTPKTWPSLGLSPSKWEKTCPRSGRTATQKFMPIGKAPAEKSVTVHKKGSHSKLRILPRRPILRMAW